MVSKKTKKQTLKPKILPKEREEAEDIEIEDGENLDEEQNFVLEPETKELEPKEIESYAGALSLRDPLRQYLQEISRYSLLDQEEERRLADRLIEKGDLDAAKKLVQANLRLVVKIAMEYRSLSQNLLDLIQEGNLGLMKAVSKYDPSKGAKLSYYSSWWIRSYILKYILDNFRLVKIGTTQAQKKLFYHLMKEKARLEAQGFSVAPKLLANHLDVKEKEVREMEMRLSSKGNEMPLDAPVSPDSKRSLTQVLPDEDELADERLEREELLQILESKLPEFKSTLNDKEKKLLEERILSDAPKTLQEIADLYGLSRERARQIEAKIIEKLKEHLKQTL